MLGSRGSGDVSLTAEGLGLSSAASSLDTCVEPGRPRRSPRPVLAARALRARPATGASVSASSCLRAPASPSILGCGTRVMELCTEPVPLPRAGHGAW